MSLRVFEDVACTVCGCVCDDLRLTVENERITRAEGACGLAEGWFLNQDLQHPPAAEMDGKPAEFAAAIKQAAEILAASRAPLIYGLSRSSTQGQRAAVRLADKIGATIDTTASLCHAPSIMAIQEVGESTCTLGEIKNRADLVLFWGVDPVQSHPRHLERYSGDATGLFIPDGRKDRTIIVLDGETTEVSKLSDQFIKIDGGQDFEVINVLRCLVRGIEPVGTAVTGATLSVLRDLADKLKSARCGVVFFGLGLARRGHGNRNVEALLRLVRDLNAHTRFHARRMRIPGDVTGADNVLCWQTGYPFSVNLARGYPRYNPGEYSANILLEREEVDACLFVGSEGVREMSAQARDYLDRIPAIALDHPTISSTVKPTIRFTTAVYGIHLSGTAYRMDEVPIPLRAVLPPQYPSDEEVLTQIRQGLADGCE